MKHLALSLLVSTQAFSARIDPQEPMREDLEFAEVHPEEYTFDDLLYELETEDLYSGRLVEVQYQGQHYLIDRTSQPPKPASKQSPAIARILSDLGVKAEGQIRVTITQRTFKDGKIASEDVWQIDVGGMWQAQTGMNEAMQKNHR